MNLINKTFALICSITAITVFYSCEKSGDKPAAKPEPAGETVKLSIRLNGDITTVENPMSGARMAGNNTFARDLYDSTIYAVHVRSPQGSYAAGLFNTAGLITLEVPKDTSFVINVAVIKRGTGLGLSWAGTTGNYQFFMPPIARRLMNEMEYAGVLAGSPWALDTFFLSSMSYHRVRADILNTSQDVYFYSELDSYFGSTILTVADTAASLDVSLKRISFGIKYQASNFSEGTLIAEYDSLMKTQGFTPADLPNSTRIYTADAYRSGEYLAGAKIPLTLKWKKPDGSIVTIGQTELSPKRNSLTTINVTLPAINTAQASIVLTDSSFTNDPVVNF